MVGETVTITANVRNAGLKATSRSTPFTVKFYDDDPASGRATLIDEERVESPISFNSVVEVSVPYTVRQGGVHTITVVVDERKAIAESDEKNNAARTTLGQMPSPQNLTVMAVSDKGTVMLRWQAPKTGGIQAYRVYRSTTSGKGYELVGGETETTFVDELAMRGVKYYYVVTAIDQYGIESPASNETGGGASGRGAPDQPAHGLQAVGRA